MNLQTAREMLAFYIEAEKAVLQGQSMTKGGRTWTRADLADIRRGRQEWESKVTALSTPAHRRGPALARF